MQDASSQSTGPTSDDSQMFESFRLLPTVTAGCADAGARSRSGKRNGKPLLGAIASNATLSPEGSPVSLFHVPAGVRLKTIRAGSGRISLEPFVYFDRDSCLWKTFQGSLFPVTDSTKSSVIWPRWGLMRSGECFRRAPLVRLIRAKEYSLLPTLPANESGEYQRDRGQKGKERPTLAAYALAPTLTVSDAKGTTGNNRPGANGSLRNIASHGVKLLPTVTATATKRGYSGQVEKSNLCPSHAGGPINPEWAEHLMGFPISWTALEEE